MFPLATVLRISEAQENLNPFGTSKTACLLPHPFPLANERVPKRSFRGCLFKTLLLFEPSWQGAAHSCLIAYPKQFTLEFWFNHYTMGAWRLPPFLLLHNAGLLAADIIVSHQLRGDTSTSDYYQKHFSTHRLLVSIFSIWATMREGWW